MTKNTANKMKSALSAMKTKHAAMKPMHKFAFAIVLCGNLFFTLYMSFWALSDGVVTGFVFMILYGIPLSFICAFAVLLGAALFKLTLPQEQYIKKSRLDLILAEFTTSVMVSWMLFGVSFNVPLYILGNLFGWQGF